MYFKKGKLPWQGIIAATKQQKYEKISEMKRSLSIDDTCKNWPNEFGLFMKYARNLRFHDEPDYTYLRKLFHILFCKQNLQYDHIYDWTILQQQQNDRDRERNRRNEQLVQQEIKNSKRRSKLNRFPIGDVIKHKPNLDKKHYK